MDDAVGRFEKCMNSVWSQHLESNLLILAKQHTHAGTRDIAKQSRVGTCSGLRGAVLCTYA
eukprot:scaffold164404_cov27-Tisochrysis_lutea.AAC.1